MEFPEPREKVVRGDGSEKRRPSGFGNGVGHRAPGVEMSVSLRRQIEYHFANSLSLFLLDEILKGDEGNASVMESLLGHLDSRDIIRNYSRQTNEDVNS